jgi:hypothetical protein
MPVKTLAGSVIRKVFTRPRRNLHAGVDLCPVVLAVVPLVLATSFTASRR